jgi:hypothetical protein
MLHQRIKSLLGNALPTAACFGRRLSQHDRRKKNEQQKEPPKSQSVLVTRVSADVMSTSSLVLTNIFPTSQERDLTN